MATSRDLNGERFGKWFVLRWVETKYGEQFWLCKCDCGTEKIVIGGTLKKGLTKSCGCASKDWCRTHGKEGSKVYNTWAAMLQRCNNPKSRNYKNYGARGIKVCDKWLKFENFYEDMGEQTDGLSIERKDNNGNYCKDNCIWADKLAQARNRRTNVMLEYCGEKRCISEWAEIVSIKRKIIENRIRVGWDIKKALETPSRNKR